MQSHAAGSPNPGTGRPQYLTCVCGTRVGGYLLTPGDQALTSPAGAPISSLSASSVFAVGRSAIVGSVRMPACPPKQPTCRCSRSWFATAPRPPRARCSRGRLRDFTSDDGRKQAQATAERIAALKHRPVAIYSSPLERARETTQPLSDLLGMPVDRPRLIECDFGEWTGAELKNLRRLPEWRTVQSLPSTFQFPGGESFETMQHRIITTLDRLASAHLGQTFVASGRADPIKAAISAVAGVPLDLFQRFAPPLAQCHCARQRTRHRSCALRQHDVEPLRAGHLVRTGRP